MNANPDNLGVALLTVVLARTRQNESLSKS